MYVRIDGQGRAAEREHEDAGRGLGANTGERAQPLLRLVQRHLAEKRQVERSTLRPYVLKNALDPRRLHLR